MTRPSQQHPGDRLVDAADVERACSAVSLSNERDVLAAFVLVMAWGSGTSAPRSYRNTAAALADPRLFDALTDTARLCRDSSSVGMLETAYGRFRVAGVRRSYFTKWFRFSGRMLNSDREWQPLILDDRVLATLNGTLGQSTLQLEGTRLWGARYRAYVEHMHGWAAALRSSGTAVTADPP